MMKLVVTVLGQDRVGIIAEVSRVLAENNINILSINQNILEGIFNMVLLSDMSKSDKTLEDIQQQLKETGENLGVEVRGQHADIFYSMHRV